MRLFWYYTWHSFVNTMKKILKTWLAFFGVCLVMGVVIGLIIGMVIPKSKNKDKKKSTEPTSSISEVQKEEEEKDDEISVKKQGQSFLKKHNLTKENIVDLAITALFLLSLASNIANSSKSGRIFKPADVPMLFATPLKPQSVLLFRLVSTLAASLLISLYMVFQLPNLIGNAGLTPWGAVSCIVAYAIILIFGTLVQVSFYTITSRRERGTGDITKFLIIAYAALAGVFAIYKVASGKGIIDAAVSFFANKNTFWVPFWGWMRGMCYYANTGNTMMSLLYLGLCIVASALVVVFIWKMKADFYEDALYETEKQAAMVENMKNASAGGAITREKDRSAKLDRDGFHYGSGANVFFFKAIFNHFRFSTLKVFSKTTIVYTLAAGAAAWFAHTNGGSFDMFTIPACVLAFLTFYRTLGNPLKEDTSREFFVLIPESPLKKIWFSLLGSTAECALDIFIPILVAEVILRSNPLTVLGWFIFILAVSLFGTAVGTFVNLSVPGDHASTIKTLVQIFFLYFGILPAAVFVFLGIYLHMVAPMLLIGAVVVVGLASLFTLVTPHFLTNR